jgi:hypothetical protein
VSTIKFGTPSQDGLGGYAAAKHSGAVSTAFAKKASKPDSSKITDSGRMETHKTPGIGPLPMAVFLGACGDGFLGKIIYAFTWVGGKIASIFIDDKTLEKDPDAAKAAINIMEFAARNSQYKILNTTGELIQGVADDLSRLNKAAKKLGIAETSSLDELSKTETAINQELAKNNLNRGGLVKLQKSLVDLEQKRDVILEFQNKYSRALAAAGEKEVEQILKAAGAIKGLPQSVTAPTNSETLTAAINGLKAELDKFGITEKDGKFTRKDGVKLTPDQNALVQNFRILERFDKRIKLVGTITHPSSGTREPFEKRKTAHITHANALVAKLDSGSKDKFKFKSEMTWEDLNKELPKLFAALGKAGNFDREGNSTAKGDGKGKPVTGDAKQTYEEIKALQESTYRHGKTRATRQKLTDGSSAVSNNKFAAFNETFEALKGELSSVASKPKN